MRRISVVTRAALISIVSITLFSSGLATVANAVDDSGGVVVNDSSTAGAAVEQTSTSQNGAWSKFVDWFTEVTDLDTLETQSLAWTLMHAALLIIGLVLLVFGARTYDWAFGRGSTVQHVIARVVGVALLVAAFIL